MRVGYLTSINQDWDIEDEIHVHYFGTMTIGELQKKYSKAEVLCFSKVDIIIVKQHDGGHIDNTLLSWYFANNQIGAHDKVNKLYVEYGDHVDEINGMDIQQVIELYGTCIVKSFGERFVHILKY